LPSRSDGSGAATPRQARAPRQHHVLDAVVAQE